MEQQAEQEKQLNAAANDPGSRTIALAPSGTLTFLVALRQVIDTPIDRLPSASVTAAAETLATGAVLCALAFIILSFLYPDRITASLTILAPILTFLIQHKQKLKKVEGKPND
ncbi:MAG: hypothetical protein KGL39_31510 [Patescibacteria group bacterium]|nr:hypothetical protein [Patescibacteria group bacterium]